MEVLPHVGANENNDLHMNYTVRSDAEATTVTWQ